MQVLPHHIGEQMKALKCAIIVPTYNNHKTIAVVLEQLLQYTTDIFVINDGSTDNTTDILQQFSNIQVVNYSPNRGKGYAIRYGLQVAYKQGFEYAITIDSDGQHYVDDLPIFVDTITQKPNSLLIGARNLKAENMPEKNTFANKFSNFWYKVETGQKLSDTQSGYRLYPLKALANLHYFSNRYEFEVEVIVRAAWKGVNVENVPIKVYYPPEGERVSHFKPARDFFRISVLNTVLVLIAVLWYYPWKFLQSLTRENIKNFISKNITHSTDSNFCIAASVALGCCCAILPIWGYQLIASVAIAHIFKLNKVIAGIASNISIPPLIPFILFGSYAIGCSITNQPIKILFNNISLADVTNYLLQYLLGSCVLSIIVGLIAFAISWLLLFLFRKQRTND